MRRLLQRHNAVLLILIAALTAFVTTRTSGLFTATQARAAVATRDAQAKIRTQWLQSLTDAICPDHEDAPVCNRQWREEIAAAGAPKSSSTKGD